MKSKLLAALLPKTPTTALSKKKSPPTTSQKKSPLTSSISSQKKSPRTDAHKSPMASVKKPPYLLASGVACLPQPSKDCFIWIPKLVLQSRGLFKQMLGDANAVDKVTMKSVGIHLQKLENTFNLKSTMEIQISTNGRRQIHTLISVNANGSTYVMEDIDKSVVYAIFGKTVKRPIFDKNRDAVTFGHWFLLLMVYPGHWFPMLFGTSSASGDVGRSVFVERQKNHGFFLTKLEDNGWKITPESSNITYEYH